MANRKMGKKSRKTKPTLKVEIAMKAYHLFLHSIAILTINQDLQYMRYRDIQGEVSLYLKIKSTKAIKIWRRFSKKATKITTNKNKALEIIRRDPKLKQINPTAQEVPT